MVSTRLKYNNCKYLPLRTNQKLEKAAESNVRLYFNGKKQNLLQPFLKINTLWFIPFIERQLVSQSNPLNYEAYNPSQSNLD